MLLAQNQLPWLRESIDCNHAYASAENFLGRQRKKIPKIALFSLFQGGGGERKKNKK